MSTISPRGRSSKTTLAAAAMALLVGCGGSTIHVDLAPLPGPPQSSLDGDHLQLAVGTALIVDAQPKDEDDEALVDAVSIVAEAPFQALRTTTKNRFVFSAETSGHATIRIVVDGAHVRTLTADTL